MNNNSKSPLYLLLLILCISLFSINNLIAQENNVFEITQKNENSKASQNDNNRKEFYELAFNLYPTHYVEKNSLKTTYDSGDPIKMTFEDSKSFDWLKSKNNDSLELIIISLDNKNDLNTTLDLTDKKDFKNLKYVYVKCYFNCSEDDIEKFVKANKNVRIFYSNLFGG